VVWAEAGATEADNSAVTASAASTANPRMVRRGLVHSTVAW